ACGCFEVLRPLAWWTLGFERNCGLIDELRVALALNMAVIASGEERADVDAENTVALARVAARLRQRRGPRNPPRGRYAYARAGRALRDRGRRQQRGGHRGHDPAAPRDRRA